MYLLRIDFAISSFKTRKTTNCTNEATEQKMISQIDDILDVFPLVKRVADKLVDF